MKNDSSSTIGAVVVIIAFVFIVGLIGKTTEKELCLHPGCDNERIEGTRACYKHGSNSPSNSYKSYGSSYSNSSYSDEDDAYDEFGYVDDETYEYGYEEAYDEWMNEAE